MNLNAAHTILEKAVEKIKHDNEVSFVVHLKNKETGEFRVLEFNSNLIKDKITEDYFNEVKEDYTDCIGI